MIAAPDPAAAGLDPARLAHLAAAMDGFVASGYVAGALTLIEVLISINIFIGLINMLPMLPLDGGHVVIAGYEWIRTRKGRPRYQADVAKMMPVAYAFVAFLLLLVSTSVYLDLTHPIANPFR